MNIGRAIKTTRQERAIKQYELAGAIGVTGSYLSLIEYGKKVPSHDLVVRIAAELQVSAGYLYFRALDKEDFPKNKQELFNALYPTIQHIIIQLL